jgi:hypothetical protein
MMWHDREGTTSPTWNTHVRGVNMSGWHPWGRCLNPIYTSTSRKDVVMELWSVFQIPLVTPLERPSM